MLINADFRRRVVLHAGRLDWVASPMPGVERRMLDRVGGEVARATSIVRYASGSSFSAHTHDGGEEFLVLEGIFQDEHGDYPAGSYVRNPPTSRHIPRSAEGCTIFVKLHQFDPADRTFARIDTRRIGAVPDPARPGVAVTPLFEDARETVSLELVEAETSFEVSNPGGVEMLVMDGHPSIDGQRCEPLSWVRLPPNDSALVYVGSPGARLWFKRRHLRPEVLGSMNEALGATETAVGG